MASEFNLLDWFTVELCSNRLTKDIVDATSKILIHSLLANDYNPGDFSLCDLIYAFVIYKVLRSRKVILPTFIDEERELQVNIWVMKFLFPNEYVAFVARSQDLHLIENLWSL